MVDDPFTPGPGHSDAVVPLPPPPRLRRLADGALHLAAPAKINLNLLVGPRGPDGFHPVDSLVAKVTLCDDVRLRPRQDGRIVLRCTGHDCGPQESNLAVRVARALAQGRDVPGVTIDLTKQIPPGAGLGGGSSDAAAVLVGLDELWRLAWPGERLTEVAARLGSDVPLFLGPPASRITGRGETLQPVALHPFLAVLFLPGFACPTAEVYRAFDRLPLEGLRQVEASLLSAPPSRWRGQMRNQLMTAAGMVAKELPPLVKRLARALPVPVAMSGSGSALFALCDDLTEARAVLAATPVDLRDRCVLVASNNW